MRAHDHVEWPPTIAGMRRGPHGLAESYGFEPQLVTLTDEQIQEQEQNAARALWENAMPAPEAERTANPGQERSR